MCNPLFKTIQRVLGNENIMHKNADCCTMTQNSSSVTVYVLVKNTSDVQPFQEMLDNGMWPQSMDLQSATAFYGATTIADVQ